MFLRGYVFDVRQYLEKTDRYDTLQSTDNNKNVFIFIHFSNFSQ